MKEPLFPNLQLPSAELELSQEDNQTFVFDIIRKKKIVLEPEEWVRQHLIHYFINELKYPAGLIQLETPVGVNHLNQRADIVVYNKLGLPFLLAECKSYAVNLNQDVLNQILRYNAVLNAEYLLISNGLEHHCFRRNEETGQLIVLDAFPEYVEN